MLRCDSPFVIAAYKKYASFLRVRAPCLRPFYEAVPVFGFLRLFTRFPSPDGYVKRPDAALRFILRHCGVRNSTPHSSGLARLACGLFTKPSNLLRPIKTF